LQLLLLLLDLLPSKQVMQGTKLRLPVALLLLAGFRVL
jgi:hypothetical protein